VEPGSQYLQLDGKNDEQANIGVDGLYFFNRNPDFAPCALAGLTYAAERYFDTDKNNNLMVRVGLGFTKQLTRNVDFRSDLRYQYPSNKAGSGSLGDWIVSDGLNIAFGGAPQAVAPACVAPAYVAPAPVYVTPAPAPPPAPYVAPKREPKQDCNQSIDRCPERRISTQGGQTPLRARRPGLAECWPRQCPAGKSPGGC
jgi:hypothetical protein